tara:strand:+ start:96 stop:386 length:291 start_codon:yes stop_codon:yes gene_type:complete
MQNKFEKLRELEVLKTAKLKTNNYTKTIVNITLISKNNKQRGTYLYNPVVKVGDKYFYCASILTTEPLKTKDITQDQIILNREIEPQFYAANGIKI